MKVAYEVRGVSFLTLAMNRFFGGVYAANIPHSSESSPLCSLAIPVDCLSPALLYIVGEVSLP